MSNLITEAELQNNREVNVFDLEHFAKFVEPQWFAWIADALSQGALNLPFHYGVGRVALEGKICLALIDRVDCDEKTSEVLWRFTKVSTFRVYSVYRNCQVAAQQALDRSLLNMAIGSDEVQDPAKVARETFLAETEKLYNELLTQVQAGK